MYGEEVFKDLFKQVLKQCIDKGMVAGRRQAIDSVAVKANASMSSLIEKEVLDDADNYTGELNDNADEPAITIRFHLQEKNLLSCIIAGKRKPIKICLKAVKNNSRQPGL